MYSFAIPDMLQNKRGLTPLVDTMCEHGRPDSCCNLEKFYMIMPRAWSDFSGNFWTSPAYPRTTKLHWLREALEGISTLHEMGIMHRDIRPQNMLIMSMGPPRASLCDYGKAIQAKSDYHKSIGPKHTVAPEVWTSSPDCPYTAKIDMWAYGYAIADILGYTVQDFPGPEGFRSNNPEITTGRHLSIIQMLRAHRLQVAEDYPLVDLAIKLLEWDPQKRWSAEQALQHPCWYPIMQDQSEEGDTESEAPPI